ncbi:unnamed protein product [Bursaphelenchus xylophilus]|uniref:Tetraspanin n=1 Tax=Bursaphelenchus xylophilus TaxID=6326 RepID=A0A1I7STN8_BURXY|nr:unnamed protein product [Bursaphelenchus xylophilus]CAG9108164.1 unnamed protein product [Bursaphelenchus xylophilus]
MVYGCGNQMIKFFMFICNFALFLLGALIFSFSLWANLDQEFTTKLSEVFSKAGISSDYLEELQQYQASLWVFVAVGAMLCFVGFFGCCGAACESLFFLTMFFIVILVLFVIELFTLIYLKINKTGFLTALYYTLQKSTATPALRAQLKPIETLLKCCGATSETSYMYADDCKSLGILDQPDCYSVISSKLDGFGNVVEICGIIVLIIQMFSMLFSCTLSRAIRERIPAYY